MSGRKVKKDQDVEIDLIAFISLLSVCICFLLLTSIWVQISSMNFKQAVGGAAVADSKPEPQVWIKIFNDGKLVFNVENAKLSRKLKSKTIQWKSGEQKNPSLISEFSRVLKDNIPEIRTALLQPSSNTTYEDIVMVMDAIRTEGFSDLGIAPL